MSYDSTIEDLVQSVKDFLADNVGAYLGEINDAKNDGVSLSPFRSVRVTDADPYALSEYPVLILYPETLAVENIASGWDQATMTFVSLVACKHSGGDKDADISRVRLLRYTEAVRQVLRDYHDLGVTAFDVSPRGMEVRHFPTDTGVTVGTIRFQVVKEIPS
jgi:hypothetical protein